MENNLVVQSNDLVLAAYTMTIKEKQLFLSCVSQIDSRTSATNVTKESEFTVSVKDIERVFYKDTNRQNIYRDIEQASNSLYERDIVINLEDNKILRTRIVSSILYDPNNQQVTLTFSKKILPYLTQLSANFTKYRLIEISELSSIHAIRLYELIVCWLNQWKYSITIEIEDFKDIMGVAGKYAQLSSLKLRVIDTAIKEINENTDYKVTVEYHKRGKGKAIKELTLSFHKKSLAKLEDKKGKISEDMLIAIVRSRQFEADYNNYHRLSGEGKSDRDAFRSEMKNFITTYPEDFEKKPLENYLK